MATGGRKSILCSSEPFYDFICSNCAKDDQHTEGECFCVECNETFCTSCLVHHNKIAAMRQHKLLEKTKMATRRPQDLLQQPTSRCTVHPDQVINMYCGQDNLVCCTVCIAEDHRTCVGVIYIPKNAKNIKTSQKFLDVNSAIDCMRADIEMLKKGKKLDLDRLTKQHLQIKVSIEKIRDQINKHLDDLETAARDELERMVKVQEDQINGELAKLEDQLSEMNKTASKLKESQNESQVFVDMKEAIMKQSEQSQFLNNVEKSVGKPAIHFYPNNKIFNILEKQSLGRVECLDEKIFTSVSHHEDFDVKTDDDDETCHISGSCQMLDGKVVIIDHMNHKIKLLDTAYKVTEECKLPFKPYGVSRTSPSEVAITLYKKRKVQFAEVTDKISLKGSFSVGDTCRGIAYNEGLLYVACGGGKETNEGPGQVQVYNMAGRLLQTHKRNLFSMPVAIVVSECRTKIHIADTYRGIFTMNLDGTGLTKFEIKPAMYCPTGISVLNNDDLIVSVVVKDAYITRFSVCDSSQTVILLDKNGQQKAILLKAEDITEPFSVLYDRSNSRLVVSMWMSNHIKIYNLL